ncbi:MAG: smalltalk protein [Prevotella sp.]|nr:smalltalk protein [Prevotella sp.]
MRITKRTVQLLLRIVAAIASALLGVIGAEAVMN